MEHRLDVSMLEPCEPLERTLEALNTIGSGDYLRVSHRREPLLLYPLLEKSGHAWHCVELNPGAYEIYIWREHDGEAAEAASKNYL